MYVPKYLSALLRLFTDFPRLVFSFRLVVTMALVVRRCTNGAETRLYACE